MPALSCYRLRDVAGAALDEYVDWEERSIDAYGPTAGSGFEAKLYVASAPPHPPTWAGFVAAGFSPPPDFQGISSVGALLVVRTDGGDGNRYFAFTFGSGRHLLLDNTWQRGFGLRVALNLIYPRTAEEGAEPGRIIAVDSKRRGSETMRARRQASRATTIESFDIDRLRDMVGAATGRPADAVAWGKRISGGDALHFDADVTFDELGTLCLSVQHAHDRDDYKERFAWLDDVQPVLDGTTKEALEDRVLDLIRDVNNDDLELAPPEIVDWERVRTFRFHCDSRQGTQHPELRLPDYRAALSRDGRLGSIDADFLKHHHIVALSGDGHEVHKWSVWRCLTGEIVEGEDTFVLDEGDFFLVSRDFLTQLNAYIGRMPVSTCPLPAAKKGLKDEDAYNRGAVERMSGVLLLDKRLVKRSATTSRVELCDILSHDRALVHVKRHLGSRDLSHLFSQGFVSARLLQEDPEFRRAAQAVIDTVAGGTAFPVFDGSTIATHEYEIVYAIVEDWKGRSLTAALPFFGKVNLQRTAQDLENRGYRVSYVQIPLELGGVG